MVWIRSAGATPGTDEIEPDRRAGSYEVCLRRNSSSVMMSSTSFSLPRTDDGDDFDIGGVYGRGVCRIGGR